MLLACSLLLAAVSPDAGSNRDALVIAVGTTDPQLVQTVEGQVRSALRAAGVLVRDAAASNPAPGCGADRGCYARAGRERRAFAVVRVEFALVSDELALLVQAIDSATGALWAEASFVVPLKGADRELKAQLEAMARILVAKTPAADAPRIAEPLPVAPAPLVVAPAPEPEPVEESHASSTIGWIGAGFAVASAAASGIFLGLGVDGSSRFSGSLVTLDGNVRASRLSSSQANQLVSQTNLDFTLSLSLAISAVAFAAASALVAALQ